MPALDVLYQEQPKQISAFLYSNPVFLKINSNRIKYLLKIRTVSKLISMNVEACPARCETSDETIRIRKCENVEVRCGVHLETPGISSINI